VHAPGPGKRRGMEVGARGPMCMLAREAKGALASKQRGAEVPTCAREQQGRPDASHILTFFSCRASPLGFYLGSKTMARTYQTLLGLFGSLSKLTKPRIRQAMILASIWLSTKTYQLLTLV
jgi:hypothetical protein